MMRFKHSKCPCCHMVGLNIKLTRKGVCTKCAPLKDRDYYLKEKALPVWYDGDTPMFTLPSVLTGLTPAEMMLIQRLSPFVPLHHIKNGLFGLKGHVCAFEQDVQDFVNRLPRKRNDVAMIQVLQRVQAEIGGNGRTTIKDFKVRKKNVLDALVFLKEHSSEYADIEIDMTSLDWIEGEEGDLESHLIVSNDMKTIHDASPLDDDLGPAPEQAISPKLGNEDVEAFGFIDEGGVAHLSADDQIINNELQSTVEETKQSDRITVDWPAVSDVPINEYGSTRIFAQAFPWLFPGGIGDVKDHPGSISDWGKQLLYYEDGRFAADKIFSFFAMNYIVRHRNSSSGRFFIENFQKNRPETLQELQDSIRAGDTSFVNSLTYYNKRVKGSNPYWIGKRSELYTWINHHVEAQNGAPTFFITLSCAEYFWKDVIELLKDRLEHAGIDVSDCYVGSSKMSSIINDYAIVIQEYFQKRVETWLDTVGKDIFDIENYWVRYEFAPGRGQIHAHLLAISNDQTIYELCYNDLQEKGGEAKRAKRLADWAESRFGLTASVGEGFDNRKIDNNNTPVQFRFSDIGSDEQSIYEDTQNLLKFCQCHNCSGFCMRQKTKKR